MCHAVRHIAVLRVVEELQRPLVTAVAVVIEHSSVAALQLAWPQDHEVRGEVYQAAIVHRRLVEIHDGGLRGGARIDHEVRAPRQTFIRPNIAECVVIRERNTLGDLQRDLAGHGRPFVCEAHCGVRQTKRQVRTHPAAI
jgi:hypothetical protein